MSDERDGYQAYLLRLWRVPSQGRWRWRASLESRHTGERQAFAGLEQLFAFLSERCDSHTCPEEQSPRGTPGTREKGKEAQSEIRSY